MNDLLSISAAAREAPAATALIVGAQRFSFAQLADLVQQRLRQLAPAPNDGGVCPLTGTNALDTALTLYALLEARVPVLLLHPKLTAAERAAELDAVARAAHLLPPDAAVILYTSGTTGNPRGAVLSRAALLASARASSANLGWQPDDCWLLAMPLARVGGLSIITRCLAARRPVALVPRFDVDAVPQWIERYRTTLVSVVPTMLTLLLERHPVWLPPGFLRAVLLGGAAASPHLLASAAARALPIVITYGCTESCSQIVATPYASRLDAARCGAGRPLADVQLRLVDGRIQFRGPMRMAGYLGEPPLPPDAWFDTGDLGELDEQGCLHLHARAGDLILSGGDSVYPAEVERVLETCPGVLAAAVFGVPDETWGEIVAALLVADGTAPTENAIARHLAARLARYKRPRRIAFIDYLPHTAAGKLDRKALSGMAAALRPLAPIENGDGPPSA